MFKDLEESVEGIYLKCDCEGPEEHLPSSLQAFLLQAASHLKFMIVIGELSYDNHTKKGYAYWNRWRKPLAAIDGWALLEQSELRGNPGLSKTSFKKTTKCFHERFEWVFARKHS